MSIPNPSLAASTHKPRTNASPMQHKVGSRFLASATFGPQNVLNECSVDEWAPSGLFVKLNINSTSAWYPVQSFDIVEILDATPAHSPKRRLPKATDLPRNAKGRSTKQTV